MKIFRIFFIRHFGNKPLPYIYIVDLFSVYLKVNYSTVGFLKEKKSFLQLLSGAKSFVDISCKVFHLLHRQ